MSRFAQSPQEPNADGFDPSSAPELPSSVEALPIAWLYWLLFLLAAALLLWWSWQWMVQAQHKRNKLMQERRVVAEEASATSAQRAWRLLQDYLQDLSSDQRREAECLSHLLREQVGRSVKRDCHSATDAEILAIANSGGVEHGGTEAASSNVDLAPTILQPLLVFTSGVLFADQRPAAAIWQATLKDVEAWLKTQGEVL